MLAISSEGKGWGAFHRPRIPGLSCQLVDSGKRQHTPTPGIGSQLILLCFEVLQCASTADFVHTPDTDLTMPESNGINGQRSGRPRVLVPEKLSPDGLALLRNKLEVDERKGLSPEELASMIQDYDALIIRSETKVTASLLAAGKRLKVVARAGVGVDNVGEAIGP